MEESVPYAGRGGTAKFAGDVSRLKIQGEGIVLTAVEAHVALDSVSGLEVDIAEVGARVRSGDAGIEIGVLRALSGSVSSIVRV